MYHQASRTDILQQMRLIHHVPFSRLEVEFFRQIIWNNVTHGVKYVLDSMEDMDLKVSAENSVHVELIENANDIRDGEAYPQHFFEPLNALWNDKGIQQAWGRGNEAALPEKYTLFFMGFAARIAQRCPFKSWIFLLSPTSTISVGLRSHRTGHPALLCTDDRYHGDGFPSPRPRDVHGRCRWQNERAAKVDPLFSRRHKYTLFGEPKWLRPMPPRIYGCGACNPRLTG
jgi:hypothetical protein